MTDKQWYAQLSTLVLDGIDQVNKGQDTWHNQYKIRDFVCNETTPEKKKIEIYRKVALNVSEAMKCVGYISCLVFLIIDVFEWMVCLAKCRGLVSPIVLLLMAVALGVMGLAGQIWNDILE